MIARVSMILMLFAGLLVARPAFPEGERWASAPADVADPPSLEWLSQFFPTPEELPEYPFVFPPKQLVRGGSVGPGVSFWEAMTTFEVETADGRLVAVSVQLHVTEPGSIVDTLPARYSVRSLLIMGTPSGGWIGDYCFHGGRSIVFRRGHLAATIHDSGTGDPGLTERVARLVFDKMVSAGIPSTMPVTPCPGKRPFETYQLAVLPPEGGAGSSTNGLAGSHPPRSRPAVVLNGGDALSAEPKPVLVDGVTMVSLRAFCEALGMEVRWAGEAMAATAYHGEKLETLACFTVGEDTAQINGEEVQLRQAPYILDGTMMVPIRELVEGLGGTVKWIPEPQIVEVTYHLEESPPAELGPR